MRPKFAQFYIRQLFALTCGYQSGEKEGAGVLDSDLRCNLGTSSCPSKDCGAHCCTVGHPDCLPTDEFYGVRDNIPICKFRANSSLRYRSALESKLNPLVVLGRTGSLGLSSFVNKFNKEGERILFSRSDNLLSLFGVAAELLDDLVRYEPSAELNIDPVTPNTLPNFGRMTTGKLLKNVYCAVNR